MSQDHQENLELMEDLVHQDLPEMPDNVDQLVSQEPQDFPVCQESRDIWDPVDSLEHEEKKEAVENQDVLVKEVSPDNVDPQGIQELLVLMVKMETE